jgi:ElaB/YqjD/DUF883 family membrane-anchored ribosome-binding protein
MNEKQLEKNVSQDVAKVQKDFGALVEDSAARLGKLGDNVSQATVKTKEDVTTWVEDSAAHLSKGFEKFSGEAKETVVDAAAAVKKDVSHRLSHYNTKAQEIAGNFPDSMLAKKVAMYPWVAIAIGLTVGFLLGILLRPSRQMLGEPQI